jgi:hypothetical protein
MGKFGLLLSESFMEQSVGQVRRFVALFEVFEVLELITTFALNQLDEIGLIHLWP